MKQDKSRKPRAAQAPQRNDTPDPGRLAEDDRGNITWQWADDDELQADDTDGSLTRLQALVDPKLDVVDDRGGSPHSSADNYKGLTTGYNPYDSGALGKSAWKKKRSLQELSKWIETRRVVESKKDE
jgi:transcription initiation factor TFIIIB Brf1 subunit/transcription initiation factor TFIIB